MVQKKGRDSHTRKLFREQSGQTDMFEKSFEEELEEKSKKPVECLGMTFENDEARREHFLAILREKLKDPEFREVEGFPIGSDEDILALSDPPYYTACPNPFIGDFIKDYGQPYDPKSDNYQREPFAADVSEGKNDPIYRAHSYHTKVPHKAIMRYILHYTEPGDVVLDGFCGTGMTGVAAQLCSDRSTIESLGYRVQPNGAILDDKGSPVSKFGVRPSILNDLCPVATFIAHNYNIGVNPQQFRLDSKRILEEIEDECGWMYETFHTDGKTRGRINYAIWSDVFTCPECAGELVFWHAAVGKEGQKVCKEFACPNCNATLTRQSLNRSWVTKFDKIINQAVRQVKQVPVVINYSIGTKRFDKVADGFDLELIEEIERKDIPHWFPTDRMPQGEESRRNDDIGITHVHHYYTKRSLWTIAAAFSAAKDSRHVLLGLTGPLVSVSKMYRWTPNYEGGGPLSGTLYVPAILREISALSAIRRFFSKLPKIYDFFVETLSKSCGISTQSTTTIQEIPHSIIDYVFTDPPFGGNLMYSELNFLWEAWLRCLTNNEQEAIENKVQQKGILEYQGLMLRCFLEYHRVLKPGRWITVEFHNSKNSVWNAIQEAMQRAGFIIADVRVLDKKQGSFKQITSASAVKRDLIISAYKAGSGLEERFKLVAGSEEGVWDFVRTHLDKLPIFVSKDGRAEIIAERQNYLLYDRMVAFHVQRGVTVPLSAAEFYLGLTRRFPERDGMYFLPDQVAEYDKKRMTVKEVLQLELFVTDESSAIQWLKQQLTKKPQTFQDVHPQFLKEISGWQKHEKALELSDLLQENFLRYDGMGEVTGQIHSYLSTNFKELRKLAKDDPTLKSKAKDRWYVPDPNKAGDLEKLREKALLREFEEYRESKQKKLKVFRLEAVRAGFKKAWQERDYETIISVARKISENVLQEDPKLLMWYDQALTRMGADL